MRGLIITCSVCLLLLGTTASYSQTAQGATSVGKTTLSEIEGTYQIEVVGSRNKPMMPANLLELVNSNRQQAEVKYIKLTDEFRLKILPFSEIKKADFKPVPSIVYVAE